MNNKTKPIGNKHVVADAAFLVLALIVATIFTLVLSLNLLAATILLYVPPALYISCRRREAVARSLIYAITITIISILTDYLAERDQSWVSTSMFDLRLAGIVPFEALIWVFLLTYLTVMYYQYFFDLSPRKLTGKRMPYVFLAAGGVVTWFALLAKADIGSFTIDYYYIKFGLGVITFCLLTFIASFPHYMRPLLSMVPYFFALGLVNMILGLHFDHWSYPGSHFIGWVELGAYRFPLEEFIFWIILYAPFIITQFEFFNNDRLELRSNRLVSYFKKRG